MRGQLSRPVLRGLVRGNTHRLPGGEVQYVAQNLVTLVEDKATEVLKRVDALEQDEDVQRVFHNLGSTNTPVSL